MVQKHFWLIVLALGIAGCDSSSVTAGLDEDSLSATTPGPAETPYCNSPITYASAVTITGTAHYLSRQFFGDALGGGLGSSDPHAANHPAVESPIRYAEVRVLDTAGVVVQCAQTDAGGNFTFNLPQGNANYTLYVNSRTFPTPALSAVTHAFVSVLSRPSQNRFYSLVAGVNAAASSSVGTLTAPANGNLLGGAFNIFDQIVRANEYLVAQAGHCSVSFTLCSDYDPARHKVSAYWEKGFNPNDFFAPNGGGLSFYLPGYSRLFILGGVNGDVDHSDTDHFDNSVIVHEYGHFLEENWLETDSPGGAHSGDEILDPRLAWSEGWGDFLQSAVTGDGHYIDTIGNTDGVTSVAFYVDTETPSNGSDRPGADGEGNFREFAVTRLLWDVIDPVDPGEVQFGGSDNNANHFSEIWAALTKTRYGFRDPTFKFRNPGLFLQAQNYLHLHPLGSDTAASDWSEVNALNRLTADVSHYAQLVLPASVGTCAPAPANGYYFSLTPEPSASESGTLASSDLFRNNRFYQLHIDSAHAGSHNIDLIYQQNGAGAISDLDLYVYNNRARFAVVTDMIGYSRNLPSGTPPELSVQTESARGAFTPGDYLINVNVFTGSGIGAKADYNLKMDGVLLCPGNLVPP